MFIYILASLIGVTAGLRVMTALAAVSWAAYAGWLPLDGTWLAFLGFTATPYILTLLAIGELINDKLPRTPSRKEPLPFLARILIGAVCGAALTAGTGSVIGGAAAGAIGAVAGTLAGYEIRTRVAKMAGGRDLPVALAEDAIAVAGAFLIAFGAVR